MKTVRLFGQLGKKFGRVHRFDVKSPAEAVRALCANFPQFASHVKSSDRRGYAYRVSVDRRDIDAAELNYPLSREIHISPILQGAGTSTGKIIAGGLLIAAGLAINLIPGAQPFGAAFIAIGVGFIVGGVAQALTPVPKAQDPAEKPDNQPSYVFNGPVNTTAQGQPVPIGYGRLIVGGAVISAGISIDDISPPPPPAPPPDPPPDPNYEPQPDYGGG